MTTYNEEYKPIGQWIKEARLAQNLTQAALAAKMGYSVTYVSNIERGVDTPSERALRAFEQVLGKLRK